MADSMQASTGAAEAWKEQISKLAQYHGIPDHDRPKLNSAMEWAAFYYSGTMKEYPTDTLDRVAKLLDLMLPQLTYGLDGLPDPNLDRLAEELAATSSDEFGLTVEQFEQIPDEPMPVMETNNVWIDRYIGILHSLDEWIRIGDQIRLAARRAHVKKRRGNPGTNSTMPAVVEFLVSYWVNAPRRSFKLSKWERTSDGSLVPQGKPGELATFLFDALKIIDPERKRPRDPETARPAQHLGQAASRVQLADASLTVIDTRQTRATPYKGKRMNF